MYRNLIDNSLTELPPGIFDPLTNLSVLYVFSRRKREKGRASMSGSVANVSFFLLLLLLLSRQVAVQQWVSQPAL